MECHLDATHGIEELQELRHSVLVAGGFEDDTHVHRARECHESVGER